MPQLPPSQPMLRARRPSFQARWTCHALAGALLGGLVTSAVCAEEAEAGGALRRHQALLTLEYQTIKVPGDRPLDLMGAHLFQQVLDGTYLGMGFYAPLLKGEYGGFVAADLGLHLRHRWPGSLLTLAGVSAGGGGGGRTVEHSKRLSGSGGFAKAYVGLGYDFGDFSLSATVSRLKFRRSLIDSSQLGLMLEVPFNHLTGPYSAQPRALSEADDRLAAREMGENQLSLSLDNYRQLNPQGSNHNTVRLADLQFAHYLGRDSYVFTALGMGYHGMPLYNQLLGGLGHRLRLSPALTLYGQLGLGSGGYSPDVIDTRSGLLIYPKLTLEYALSRDLGLGFSAGYMSAPKGSSRNQTYGLTLTHHLRSGKQSDDSDGPARFQGMRLAVLHQTDFNLRYRDVPRSPLQMIGLQFDLPLGTHWYLPLQASGAYNAYLGYPGYAEILAGLGLQSQAEAGESLQAFAQILAGANVHGRTVKGSAGLRYLLNERLALSVSLGQLQARGASGGRFSAHNLALGLDYRFGIPTR